MTHAALFFTVFFFEFKITYSFCAFDIGLKKVRSNYLGEFGEESNIL